MDIRLATATPLASNCEGKPCAVDKSFDREVAHLGARLAHAAYAYDPKLRERVAGFSFLVADKAEPGSASDSQGTIVIFRGVRRAELDEKALAFLIAREMGHVVARHHDERSATNILLSVLVQLFMPFTTLTGSIAALTGSTASVVGTRIVAAQTGAEQRREADAIAYELVKRQGWNDRQVAASLANYVRSLGDEAWCQALRQSLDTLAKARHDKTPASKA